MNLLVNFIKNNPKIWISLIILLVLFIAYGQTLQMYFWQDDFALLFKLQHPQGAAGSYGTGIIGQGPYKYLIAMYVPFFPIFAMNSFWYFLVGFLMYFVEVIIIYFFVKELLQNKKVAIISSLIYAAGYIGSDTALRISNYWQTNVGIILALFSFLFFTKFIHNRKRIKYYIAGIIFFFLAIEFVYVRSHSLIAPILAIDIFIAMIPFKINKLPGFILRQSPFLLLFYLRYIGIGTIGSSNLKSIISQTLSGNISIFSSFFATIGNTVIPDKIQTKYIDLFQTNSQIFLLTLFIILTLFIFSLLKISAKAKIITILCLIVSSFLVRYYEMAGLYWYRSINNFIAGAIGIYFSIFILSCSIALWKRQKMIASVLLIGFIILTSQIFGYFIQYPYAILGSTHRYLSYAFIGYSLIFGTIAYLFFEKSKNISFIPLKFRNIVALITLGFVIFPNLILSFNYQKNIIEYRSQPIRNFYQQLLEFVPNVKKNALFYFDINPDGKNVNQFQDFFSVGSMPNQTALAVFYNLDRYELGMTTNLNELFFNLDEKKNSIDDIYSFYFGPGKLQNISVISSLINTTLQTRELLKNGSKDEILSWNNTDGKIIFHDINISPSLPMLLKINMEVVPDLENIEKSLGSENIVDNNTFQKFIVYLKNKKIYYQNVQVSSLSEWRYQEIYNAIDNDLETSWRGHRIYWHNNKHEQIILDLGLIQDISTVIWVNWNNTLTPTAYTIDVSSDNKNWQTVKQVINGPERKNGEVVNDKFDSISARFVRMDITSTLSNDAPALKEIEVVKTENNDIDINSALDFASNPLSHTASQNEINSWLSQIKSSINIDVEIKTDKTTQIKKTPVKSFQTTNPYEFILIPGGTKIQSLSVKTNNLPSNLNLISATLRNLSFTEIQDRGLIKYLTK